MGAGEDPREGAERLIEERTRLEREIADFTVGLATARTGVAERQHELAALAKIDLPGKSAVLAMSSAYFMFTFGRGIGRGSDGPVGNLIDVAGLALTTGYSLWSARRAFQAERRLLAPSDPIAPSSATIVTEVPGTFAPPSSSYRGDDAAARERLADENHKLARIRAEHDRLQREVAAAERRARDLDTAIEARRGKDLTGSGWLRLVGLQGLVFAMGMLEGHVAAVDAAAGYVVFACGAATLFAFMHRATQRGKEAAKLLAEHDARKTAVRVADDVGSEEQASEHESDDESPSATAGERAS